MKGKFTYKHLQGVIDLPVGQPLTAKQARALTGMALSVTLHCVASHSKFGVTIDKLEGKTVYTKTKELSMGDLKAWAKGRKEFDGFDKGENYAEKRKTQQRVEREASASLPLDKYSPEVKAAVEAVTALAKRNAELENTITKLRELIA